MCEYFLNTVSYSSHLTEEELRDIDLWKFTNLNQIFPVWQTKWAYHVDSLEKYWCNYSEEANIYLQNTCTLQEMSIQNQ